MTNWTNEQTIQWHNEVLSLTENQSRMEELTNQAQELMKFSNLTFWSLGQQFNLMAYNETITGAELQALRRFHNLPGRLF